MQPIKKSLLAIVLVAAFSAPSRASDNRADGSLENALGKVARDLLAWMDEEKVDAVALGDFSGHPQFGYSGPLICKTLLDELEKRKKNVVRADSPNLVSGEWYWPSDKNRTGPIELQIDTKIRTSFGRSLVLTCQVTSTRDVAKFIAANGSIDPDGSKEKRHNELRNQHQTRKTNPAIEIRNQTVTALRNQPFAVEILSKPVQQFAQAAKPVKVALNQDGDPLVEIGRGEVYEIKIHNSSDKEIAVAIAIDGLDVFTFSENKNLKYHIIEPRSQALILGWHKSVEKKLYDSFLVTEYGKGAISRFPTIPRNKVGQIQVQFSFISKDGRNGAETGFGPPRNVEQTVLMRHIDPPHAFITLRYAR
jgi:hypothetical protein